MLVFDVLVFYYYIFVELLWILQGYINNKVKIISIICTYDIKIKKCGKAQYVNSLTVIVNCHLEYNRKICI